MTLTESLSIYSKQIDEWLKQSKKATAAVNRLLLATRTGNLRDIEKLRQFAHKETDALKQAAENCPKFEFDAEDYMRNNGGYTKELLEEALKKDVMIREQEGAFFCYPVLLTMEPDSKSVRIDRKLYNQVAPSFLVTILSKLQRQKETGSPNRFVEVLREAYMFAKGKKGIAEYIDLPLKDIYDILTLLPESRKTYSEIEFIRDIYFLDKSGITNSRDGHRFSLAAATVTHQRGTRVYRFVTQEGVEKQYSKIRFTPPK